jgi:hypothetical protein
MAKLLGHDLKRFLASASLAGSMFLADRRFSSG